MKNTKLRKMTVFSLFHRVLVICLISGASALECISSTLIQHNYPFDKMRQQFSLQPEKINCSIDQNACEEAQLILKLDRSALLVTHRGCATTDLHDGSESITAGHQHYNIQFNESYCSHDLCNANITEEIIPMNPDDYKVSEANDSTQCYSSLSFDPSVLLDKVICSEGYNHCYSGVLTVTDGPLSMYIYIKTCEQPPNCAVPQNQSFGPIKITSHDSSCCVGSYCNSKEIVTHILNSSLVPTVESSSESPGRSNDHLSLHPNLDRDSEDHKDYDPWSTDPQFPFPEVWPRILVSRASSLAFCSLGIVLGCTILGIWW